MRRPPFPRLAAYLPLMEARQKSLPNHAGDGYAFTREHGSSSRLRRPAISIDRVAASRAVAIHAPMTERQQSFREEVRFKVLRMLEQRPECSQRDIAEALGVSLGGVNYCLKALTEKGHVKVSNFRQSDNKLRYAYVLTPTGIAEKALLTGRFLQRKM